MRSPETNGVVALTAEVASSAGGGKLLGKPVWYVLGDMRLRRAKPITLSLGRRSVVFGQRLEAAPFLYVCLRVRPKSNAKTKAPPTYRLSYLSQRSSRHSHPRSRPASATSRTTMSSNSSAKARKLGWAVLCRILHIICVLPRAALVIPVPHHAHVQAMLSLPGRPKLDEEATAAYQV